jgi:hypothetical protein
MSKRILAGRIVTAIPVLFLLFDGAIKLVDFAPVTDSMNQLGWPPELAFGLGVMLLACVAVYLHPRTALLGAVLLTGYLGGAVATHVRVGNPLASHVLFPTYVALLLWAGLALRDPRLLAILAPRPRTA